MILTRTSNLTTTQTPARHLQRIPIDRLLVWAYQRQLVHKQPDHSDFGGSSGDGCAQMIKRAELGCRVDGGMISRAVHPDADDIHDAVMRLDAWSRAMVIAHAEMDIVPNWMQGAKPEFRAVINSRGKPKMVYDKNGNGMACMVDVWCSIGMINYHRNIYVKWWQSLVDVMSDLRDNHHLSSYFPEHPSTPETPWNS